MNKKHRKVLPIFLIITAIFFTILLPYNFVAEPIYNARSYINLEWTDNIGPLVPRDEVKEINISVTYKIQTGEHLGKGFLLGYEGTALVIIKLQIIDSSSWCNAVLQSNSVITNISTETKTINTKLYVNIDEGAPGFENGFVRIKASVGKLSFIEGYQNEFNLSFRPAYYPIISPNYPDVNIKKINPNEKAVFPIEIINEGNADTKVFFEVIDAPPGWIATVADEVLLEKGSIGKVLLIISPPRDFGYHYQDEIIQVSITPALAQNINKTGRTLYANFLIRSRGFSSSGIEGYVPYIIIIFIIGILLFLIYQRKIKIVNK